jgi:hypothetical protein
MTRAERVNLVAAAVADGRIPPARRAFWLARLRDSPSAAAAEIAGLTAVRSEPDIDTYAALFG